MALCPYCQSVKHVGGCDREALKRVIGDLREKLRVHELREQARRKVEGPSVVWVESILGMRTEKPGVKIQLNDVYTTLPVEAARQVAQHILECCEGSVADGFMYHWMTETLGQDQNMAAQVIRDFRTYREGLRKEFAALQEGGTDATTPTP